MATYDPMTDGTRDDEHWDDPEWLASYRVHMDAELDAEGDPSWVAMNQEQRANSWYAFIAMI